LLHAKKESFNSTFYNLNATDETRHADQEADGGATEYVVGFNGGQECGADDRGGKKGAHEGLRCKTEGSAAGRGER
jgi:hypothetical protein